ncbi:hypothetical protein [Amycolatopsis sp. GA6-003]
MNIEYLTQDAYPGVPEKAAALLESAADRREQAARLDVGVRLLRG